jgi:hypothetical protein
MRRVIRVQQFFRVVADNADRFSAVLATTPIIFLRCCPQHGKIIGVVGNSTENIHELKLEQLFALLPTTRKNDRRCRQQRGTFFRLVGNSAEKRSALCAATWKNCRNAE